MRDTDMPRVVAHLKTMVAMARERRGVGCSHLEG
jgi:hypothetical protein